MPEEIYRDVLESLETGVYLVDRDRKILFWNDGAEKITGYLRHEVIGRCCGDGLLVHCDADSTVLCGSACPLLEVVRDGKPRKTTLYLRHKEGYRVPVWIRAVPIRDQNGHILGAAESFDEAHGIACPSAALDAPADDGCLYEFAQPADQDLVTSALHDNLDDLAQHGTSFGVLCLRMDGLDRLRASRGVQASERMLWVAAQTLAADLRSTDLLGEWGRDQLVVIATPCPEQALMSVATRVKSVVNLAGMRWWGESVSVTFSVGATMARSGDTPVTILKRAQDAAAASLSSGGDRVTVC
jgi:PAS domain S-box-containing protein/diguanylate cyclase (GGDEF)-like protein